MLTCRAIRSSGGPLGAVFCTVRQPEKRRSSMVVWLFVPLEGESHSRGRGFNSHRLHLRTHAHAGVLSGARGVLPAPAASGAPVPSAFVDGRFRCSDPGRTCYASEAIPVRSIRGGGGSLANAGDARCGVRQARFLATRDAGAQLVRTGDRPFAAHAWRDQRASRQRSQITAPDAAAGGGRSCPCLRRRHRSRAEPAGRARVPRRRGRSGMVGRDRRCSSAATQVGGLQPAERRKRFRPAATRAWPGTRLTPGASEQVVASVGPPPRHGTVQGGCQLWVRQRVRPSRR